jgi:hypothetical protein
VNVSHSEHRKVLTLKLVALLTKSFDSSSPVIISLGVVAVNLELLVPFFPNQALPLLAACLVSIVSEIFTPSSDNPGSVPPDRAPR